MELARFKKKKEKRKRKKKRWGGGKYKIKIETQVFVKNTADRFARFSCFSREFCCCCCCCCECIEGVGIVNSVDKG